MDHLRPLERRVLKLAGEGLAPEEIGDRFRRSGAHIRRVLDLARLPGRDASEVERHGLSPLERRVLRWRAAGAGHDEIGRRFGRSADHIRRVEGMARYRQSLELLRD